MTLRCLAGTDRHTHRQDTQTDTYIHMHTYKQIDIQTYRQACIHTDRQTYIQTDIQTHIQTHIHVWAVFFAPYTYSFLKIWCDGTTLSCRGSLGSPERDPFLKNMV